MSAAGSAAPTLIVTRPEPQAGDWVRRLAGRGVAARALPLLAVGPAPDPAPLRALRQALPQAALVMFVSPNAVLQCAAAGLWSQGWPTGLRAAATGPGSVEALKQAGVPEAQIVAPAADSAAFDSEHLWLRLRDEDWRDRAVWIVRGAGGRDWFADTLRAAGARVALVQGYHRGEPAWGEAERAVLQAALSRPREHLWLLSSSEGLDWLDRQLPVGALSESRALATHPRIAERARAAGFGRVTPIDVGLDAAVAAVAAEAPAAPRD
jgi:uroporphyrinogen-III synthase